MIAIGLDLGSTTTKIAVLEDGKLLYTEIVPTGYNVEKTWRELFAATLERLDLATEMIDGIVSTGYGRNSVDIATRRVTEIMCHAAGIRYSLPGIRSIIDIGGQDSKFIQLSETGEVTDFKMNDKCAAGTGRFLEVMARALESNLEDFGKLSLVAEKAARISSMCTVFAESEVISLIARGEARENIIAGIHDSIANRMVSMMGRSGVVAPVAMTGGVARNEGIRAALEEKLGLTIEVPATAQVNGAVGAATLARK
jgi:predicted CoA-substrate-specific enzyme activase